MPKVHDRGGWPNEDPTFSCMDPANESADLWLTEHDMEDWERRVDSLNSVLGEKGLKNTDQLRRAIESLSQDKYETLSYYEKWTEAMEALLVEQGVMTTEEIDRKMADLQKDSK